MNSLNEPNIIYSDVSTLMPFDDGAGKEGHYQFTLADIAGLIENYGPEKVMTDLFNEYPNEYKALATCFYNELYELKSRKQERMRNPS